MTKSSLLVALVLLGAMGCDDAACDALAQVCERCPPDGDGPVARASCQATVESGTDDDCQARLDDLTYERSGCDGH
jgi:hypothetical protein